MSSARKQLGSIVRVLVAVGALTAACNDVIGIDEPTEMPISDGSSWADVARGGTAGRGVGTGGGNSGGGTGGGPQPAGDDAAIADANSSNDAFGGIDAPSTRDAAGSGGRGGGSVTDAAGGGANVDVVDAGLLAAPGVARGTCAFSDIRNANADTSLFASTQGSAKQKVTGADESAEIFLTNFNLGVQRNLNLRIHGPLTPGRVVPLDDVNVVEYYDVKTGAGWSSTAAVTPPSGTFTITDVVDTSFAFTITSAKLGPVLSAAGTFTVNGSGRANPQ